MVIIIKVDMEDKRMIQSELKEVRGNQNWLGLCLFLALLVNIMQYYENKGIEQQVMDWEQETGQIKEDLYLSDQAEIYVTDLAGFTDKVQQVSWRLGIPAEWLMSVMHSESRFDAVVKNYKGSGATGLIQFMPATAKDYGVTVAELGRMNHVEQLDYVFAYLDGKRRQYGEYGSLTELYLAILYPKALTDKTDYCFALYMKPSKAYVQNSGLDENKDGSVTVLDIDQRMKRKYPTAYMATIERGDGQQVTMKQNGRLWTSK